MACSWNIGLVSKGHSEEEEDHISPTREATQDNNQDDDVPHSMAKELTIISAQHSPDQSRKEHLQ